ncbi:ABC transporter substrate-binding protein, partial [Rhodococcus opacus]|nr:ABC transporter substrate-binding protein [Rhodococcus opacus]
MRIHKRLRRIGVALAATAMLVGVTACGSDTDSGSSSGSATAANGEFPVTVSGKFGDTTVESAPTRALPRSPQDADILLSLGVT